MVVPKRSAEVLYEGAVTDGDAAVLLEQPKPGIHTVSVGNLAPNEVAIIRFRYGLLLRWNGDQVRITLPTTIAPRYGDPAAGGLEPHQVPEFMPEAERTFQLCVKIRGLLRNARWSSPTHGVNVKPESKETVIETVWPSTMDHDLVLWARTADTEVSKVLIDEDGTGWVALASFQLEMSDTDIQRAHRSIKIVLDCSDSMEGDSIAQVRIAAERVLDNLRPGDRFDIIAFGSRTRVLFGRTRPASWRTLTRARIFVRRLHTLMGETEIASALLKAYSIADPSEMPRDVLLITGGHVWDADTIIAQARRANHRVFTIGVGNAPPQPLLQALADATGGACELVTPGEDMASRIQRHFQRVASTPTEEVRVGWSTSSYHVSPKPLSAFPGDTIHLFGWFTDLPQGSVFLDVELTDGRVLNHRLEIGSPPDIAVKETDATPSDLARMGAASWLPTLENDVEATAFAVHYQLFSRWTNYLVVHPREGEEEADALPIVVKIPQRHMARLRHSVPIVHREALGGRHNRMRPLSAGSRRVARSWYDYDAPYGLEPMSLSMRPPSYSSSKISSKKSILDFSILMSLSAEPTLDQLAFAGLPEALVDSLGKLVDGGADTRSVAITVLLIIAESPLGTNADRWLRETVRKFYEQRRVDTETAHAVQHVWQQWYDSPELRDRVRSFIFRH